MVGAIELMKVAVDGMIMELMKVMMRW